MKIRDLRVERTGDRIAAVGRFEWEDSARPPQEIYFRAADPLSGKLSASPEGFLIAGYFPAMHHGEKRIALEEAVCPRLLEGLLGAGRLFHLWYGEAPPRIEARAGSPELFRPLSSRSGAFLTGGIDSLHELWKNHELYPEGHPDRVRDGLFVFGVEMPGSEETPDAARRLAVIRPHLERVAREAGVELLQIDTNVRRLEPDVAFWAWKYISPPLIAASHLLAGRISTILIGSSYDYRNLMPWGTHPLLDPLLGSAALSVEHTEASTHRLGKLRELRSWPVAIRGLLVCGNSPADSVNCGTCAKCVRAMVELLSVGAPQPETLPSLESLRSEQIDALQVGPIDVENFWAATIPGLLRHERGDLAKAVSLYTRRIRAAHHPTRIRRWRRRLAEIDDRRLHGLLRRAWQRVRPEKHRQEN